MVAQWGVPPSAALHPVPVCACLTDTSHTGCHCSLRVDECSVWVTLAGSSVVLHVCCSSARPQVTFPCGCAFVRVFEEDRDDMITTLKNHNNKNRFSMLAFVLNRGEKLRKWCGQDAIPPVCCLHLCSLFRHCSPPNNLAISNPCTDATLPVCLLLKQRWPAFYPHPSLTRALQGWPRLGKDAAAFICPLAPSAPSHSPRSAVPSIAMATAGAVDGEGCLEWQPWQESGPSNDPGGGGREGEKMARREGERRGKVNVVTVTCDYGRGVQGHLLCNLFLSPTKGQPQSTITQYGYWNREITIGSSDEAFSFFNFW